MLSHGQSALLRMDLTGEIPSVDFDEVHEKCNDRVCDAHSQDRFIAPSEFRDLFLGAEHLKHVGRGGDQEERRRTMGKALVLLFISGVITGVFLGVWTFNNSVGRPPPFF